MDAKTTGELIAARRRELGISQTELAGRLHVTDKAVSRWETGRGLPGIDLLEPLAAALEVSVSELLSGKRLTPEELPREAEKQVMESMARERRTRRTSVLTTVLALLILGAIGCGTWLAAHYLGSVSETDIDGLKRQAAVYLGTQQRMIDGKMDYDGLEIVETERRGDYLAALCIDGQGNWCMCVYDRDSVFPDRWRAGGGKPSLKAGTLGSWNFGNSREAVIIFCGGDLPEEAVSYTFQNSGITYICPIEKQQVLDVFLLPDTSDISSYPEELLDENGQPVDAEFEGAAEEIPQKIPSDENRGDFSCEIQQIG